jgi:hypothetical protein
VASIGTARADPFGWWATSSHPFAVRADSGVAGPRSGGTVTGNPLANDHGATAVVRKSGLDNPAAGGLTVDADGFYSFTPAVRAATPDGRTLVGIMQSALTVPDYGTDAKGKTVKPANVAPVRIVTVDLRTKAGERAVASP